MSKKPETGWDIGGGSGRHEIGARRVLVEWHVPRHECDDECESRCLTECFECCSRAFPTRPLALAFARRVESVWGATVVEQVFEHAGTDPRSVLGFWKDVGEPEGVTP